MDCANADKEEKRRRSGGQEATDAVIQWQSSEREGGGMVRRRRPELYMQLPVVVVVYVDLQAYRGTTTKIKGDGQGARQHHVHPSTRRPHD